MYQMNIYAIPNLVCAIFFIGMGIFVLSKNRRSPMNFSFFMITLTVSIWQIGTFFMLISTIPRVAFFWGKFIYLGTSFIPAAVYYFVISFLKEEQQKKFVYLSFLLAGIVFLPLLFTDFLLSGVRKFFWGYWFQAGLLHPLFLLYYLIILATSFVNLCINYVKEKSLLKKIRIKYVLIAFLIAYIGVIDFIPDYGIEIYPPSYIPIFVYFALIAYTIVRHRLMDITIVIRKGLVYSVIVGFFTGIYIFAIFSLGLIFQRVAGYYSIFITAIVILIFALGFQPIKAGVQKYIDRIFFKGKYEYQKTLKNLSNAISSIINLEELLGQITNTVTNTMKIDKASVFLFNNDKDCFVKK